MPNNDALLTAPQVGALLGKSARTIHRMVEAGTIVAAQKLPGPNGSYLFRLTDVESAMARQSA
jgi:predicted DNA-binding transcriptional regulator AlpA